MPRRSPGSVRRRQEFAGQDAPSAPYPLPRKVRAALHRWERDRGFPAGVTSDWLRDWRDIANRPGRWFSRHDSMECRYRGCCPEPSFTRDQIERLLQSLPRRESRMLGRLVGQQDRRLLRHPAVFAPAADNWWQDPAVWWD